MLNEELVTVEGYPETYQQASSRFADSIKPAVLDYGSNLVRIWISKEFDRLRECLPKHLMRFRAWIQKQFKF